MTRPKDRKFYRVVEARRTENGRCILVTGPKERVSCGPGFVGTGRCEGVGLRIPDLQVFEDSLDHIDIVDEQGGKTAYRRIVPSSP